MSDNLIGMATRSTNTRRSESVTEHPAARRSDTATRPLDRRVRRTRELLRSALLGLMQEKSYEAITIADILDRADVGRSTFYAHFRDKDDLMLSGYDDIRAALAAERADPAADLLQPVLAVFGHVAAHRDVARQATRFDGTLPAAITGELRELTEALLREHLRQHAGPDVDPLAVEAATQFLTGALVSLLVWWTSHDLPYSAAELDRTYRRLATQGIRRYLRTV